MGIILTVAKSVYDITILSLKHVMFQLMGNNGDSYLVTGNRETA